MAVDVGEAPGARPTLWRPLTPAAVTERTQLCYCS